MQQMMIYWQTFVPQHVSGIMRANCKSLPMVFCHGCTCCGSGDMGSEMCASRHCSPDDGRKDPRNMLRNNWLPVNHHLLHLV